MAPFSSAGIITICFFWLDELRQNRHYTRHDPMSARWLKVRSPCTALDLVNANKVLIDIPIARTCVCGESLGIDTYPDQNTPMTLDSKPDALHVLNDQVAAYTCPDLQNASNDFQKRHGGLTTVNHLLHSEYRRPFDQQPKNPPWITVALPPHQSSTSMPVHPRPPLPVSSNIRRQRTIPVVPIRAPFSRSAPHSWQHSHIPNRRSSKAQNKRILFKI